MRIASTSWQNYQLMTKLVKYWQIDTNWQNDHVLTKWPDYDKVTKFWQKYQINSSKKFAAVKLIYLIVYKTRLTADVSII